MRELAIVVLVLAAAAGNATAAGVARAAALLRALPLMTLTGAARDNRVASRLAQFIDSAQLAALERHNLRDSRDLRAVIAASRYPSELEAEGVDRNSLKALEAKLEALAAVTDHLPDWPKEPAEQERWVKEAEPLLASHVEAVQSKAKAMLDEFPTLRSRKDPAYVERYAKEVLPFFAYHKALISEDRLHRYAEIALTIMEYAAATGSVGEGAGEEAPRPLSDPLELKQWQIILLADAQRILDEANRKETTAEPASYLVTARAAADANFALSELRPDLQHLSVMAKEANEFRTLVEDSHAVAAAATQKLDPHYAKELMDLLARAIQRFQQDRTIASALRGVAARDDRTILRVAYFNALRACLEAVQGQLHLARALAVKGLLKGKGPMAFQWAYSSNYDRLLAATVDLARVVASRRNDLIAGVDILQYFTLVFPKSHLP